MPDATYPTYGTGLAGSLTYSSKVRAPVDDAAPSAMRPPARSDSVSGRAAGGGHAACPRNSLMPVANIVALEKSGRKRRVLQMVHEERELNLVAEHFARLHRERRVAQPVAGASSPPAVRPRPHHQPVVGRGTEPLDRPEHVQRPHRVLGVEPAADVEDGRRDVLHVLPDRSDLPELVVVRVVHDLLPVARAPAEELLVDLGERGQRQKELVGVRRPRIEARLLLRQVGPSCARPEARVEAEVGAQHERAVVVHIVAQVVVGGRRLRRRGPKRRVRVDDAGRHVKARLRHADEPDTAVVVRHVGEQPGNRVVHVAALVHVLRAALDGHVGPDLLELALRHVPAAGVLVDEDEARFLKRRGRAERTAVGVDAVRADAVRRARDEEGIARRIRPWARRPT